LEKGGGEELIPDLEESNDSCREGAKQNEGMEKDGRSRERGTFFRVRNLKKERF